VQFSKKTRFAPLHGPEKSKKNLTRDGQVWTKNRSRKMPQKHDTRVFFKWTKWIL
jgi:hypothetical protein